MNLFDNFKSMFPTIANKVTEFVELNELQLLLTLNDNSKIIYDDNNRTIEDATYIDDLSNEKNWLKYFSQNLRTGLEIKGISQNELASKTGISRQTISKYINGTSAPSLYNLMLIAKCVGWNPEQLTRIYY